MTRPTILHLHLENTCYPMHFIGLHFQPIISFLHGACHVTFVIHFTIVSNIIVLSSSWRSIVYRLAYFMLYYTPGIHAEGYIVFVFPFVRSYVRSFVCSFVRTSFRHVEFASKFCVKVSQVVYISATTHQKAFIFGP